MYQQSKYGIVRLRDNACIPETEGNRDWVEFQTWVAQGNTPLSAPEPTITERLQRNNAAYNAATDALTGDYPQLEKDTWPTQDTETKTWLASPGNAETPWIDRAAKERGIDKEEYVRRTLIKSRQFKVMSAFLTGRRQKYEDQIKAGGNPGLDFELTEEVLLELHAIQQTVMNTAAADLQEAML
ncbi:hypothetical protein SAMN05216421_1122 [Halopseudomonas xinjiangensis]|uniref:Uncharacterized protein n=1 Tax=Halopseudomonas xinjiangensis TaxID=487184 RepID=A0A1H1QEU6_9GAMM|nr:hypothetical protein [Halopseudomonas xinjiangensis]SDS22018.1 hypothetical protein SAMN05216421_1122 [Halopseudomonas xinjiangensis]